MKKIMSSLIFVAVAGMALLVGNAKAADEVMPPVVKALIGMKIPPKSLGRPGDVPGWVEIWGEGIGGSHPIYFSELQKGSVTILAITSIDDENQTTTILDGRVIPGNLLNRYLNKGKSVLKENDLQLYRITASCWRGDSPETEGILVGMWRYKPGTSGCGGPSNFVKKAWLLDLESGVLTDISTKGVSCREVNTCGDD